MRDQGLWNVDRLKKEAIERCSPRSLDPRGVTSFLQRQKRTSARQLQLVAWMVELQRSLQEKSGKSRTHGTRNTADGSATTSVTSVSFRTPQTI